MGCPPVRGDNPRALASGLSYVQVDTHGITILCTTYISVDLAHHEIFRAKVSKGGIKALTTLLICWPRSMLSRSICFETDHRSISLIELVGYLSSTISASKT